MLRILLILLFAINSFLLIVSPVWAQENSCPNTADNKTEGACRYLNPPIDIFKADMPQESIDAYIQKYSGEFVGRRLAGGVGVGTLEEFTKRVNYIIQASKEANINPILPLGYWKSESGFSTVSTRHLGCAGDNFQEEMNCALGIREFSNPTKNPIANCARSDSAESEACRALKGLRGTFDKSHPINYPIRTFDDFAEAHGPYDDLNAQGLHSNCNSTYNILLEVASAVNACTGSGSGGPTTKSTTSNSASSTNSQTSTSKEMDCGNEKGSKEECAVYHQSQGLTPPEVDEAKGEDQNILQQILSRIAGILAPTLYKAPNDGGKMFDKSGKLADSQLPEEVQPQNQNPLEQLLNIFRGNLGHPDYSGVYKVELPDEVQGESKEVKEFESKEDCAYFPCDQGVRWIAPAP